MSLYSSWNMSVYLWHTKSVSKTSEGSYNFVFKSTVVTISSQKTCGTIYILISVSSSHRLESLILKNTNVKSWCKNINIVLWGEQLNQTKANYRGKPSPLGAQYWLAKSGLVTLVCSHANLALNSPPIATQLSRQRSGQQITKSPIYRSPNHSRSFSLEKNRCPGLGLITLTACW